MIYRSVNTQGKISPKLYENVHNQIKFKSDNGLLYATMLKSVLQYSPPKETEANFSNISWPWLEYCSRNDFIQVLKEALTLWESTYQMVMELTSKSKVKYLATAFKNANFVLKSKIAELNISEKL
mmetsp:Transcript_11444/g.12949  ORF Transcript_11444/g.12949 Transcript_11444/m.12949 type:complete len:125 (+) Transcript_11444:583-957(+)